MHSLVGPEWDIVGFDPRGTGASEPRVRCFPKGVDYALFGANTVLDGGYEIPADPRSPGARESLLAQFVRANVLTKTQFDMCERTMGYIPKYMGTTAVARDIDFITTVLEGRGALMCAHMFYFKLNNTLLTPTNSNFYGISYGSVMAQYLINMCIPYSQHVSFEAHAHIH
jgi:pimeloyl-ACP methyl ester carboxylesterase